MGTEYLLEMKDICKSFPGVKALDHVHLNVRPGQVHALMGENGAGKSTLMKCLFGIYHKDAGEITLNGKEINFKSPHDALNHGVSMIHQELEQVQMRNVADNIWLGRYPTRLGQIDDGRMLRDTEALMKEFGIDIDPRTKISDLSVSMRQMVEIVKAASWNAKIIVMDVKYSMVLIVYGVYRVKKKRKIGTAYTNRKKNVYDVTWNRIRKILKSGIGSGSFFIP